MYHMCSQDDHPGPLRHRPVLSWTEPSARLTPGAFSFLVRISEFGILPARQIVEGVGALSIGVPLVDLFGDALDDLVIAFEDATASVPCCNSLWVIHDAAPRFRRPRIDGSRSFGRLIR